MSSDSGKWTCILSFQPDLYDLSQVLCILCWPLLISFPLFQVSHPHGARDTAPTIPSKSPWYLLVAVSSSFFIKVIPLCVRDSLLVASHSWVLGVNHLITWSVTTRDTKPGYLVASWNPSLVCKCTAILHCKKGWAHSNILSRDALPNPHISELLWCQIHRAFSVCIPVTERIFIRPLFCMFYKAAGLLSFLGMRDWLVAIIFSLLNKF